MRKKRIVSILIAVIILTVTMNVMPNGIRTARAEIITTPDGFRFDKITGNIVEYTGNASSVTIPSAIDGVSVKSIGQYAFSVNWDLTSVVIPNSVETIGHHAFWVCKNLTSIIIPNGVSSIKYSAFMECESLTSIILPNRITTIEPTTFQDCTNLTDVNIPDGVTTIGEHAFSGCTSLPLISIPDSVTTIGWGTFANCQSLENCVLPNSVTSIGEWAFFGCSSLSSMIIPDSITTIEDNTFGSCDSLMSISISDTVTSIGELAFANCINLNSVSIPNSVISIGRCAFWDCENLTSVAIPYQVEIIEDSVFEGCYRLSSIDIPNSVTSIGESAFYDCRSLATITIPESVTLIGVNAFSSCDILASINVESSNLNYKSIDGVLFNKNCTTLFCYPMGKSDTSYNIPYGVTSIGVSAFDDCRNLSSVTIPNTVSFIGGGAFFLCSNLAAVDIPYGVPSIEPSTFAYCRNLISVKLPNSIASVGDKAFYYCSKLENIILPFSTISIKESAFEGCSELISIYIPESVIDIAYNSFNNHNSELTIYGVAGSEAEAFAIINNIKFSTDFIVRNDVLIQLQSVANAEFGVIVIDGGTFQPVEGVSVQIEGEANVLTDKNGSVAFSASVIPGESSQKNVELSKTGYYTTRFPLSAKPGEYCVKYVYRDTGKPKVLELYVTDTGYDVLNEHLKFGQGGTDGVTSLTMVTSCDGGTDVEYRLIQDGEIVVRSETATFDVDFESDLKPGYKVYAQVVNLNGEGDNDSSEKIQTGMFIYNSDFLPSNDKCSISLGKETNFTLPGNIPIIGGKEISSGFLDDIPFSLEVDEDGKIKVSVGLDASSGGYEKQKEAFKEAIANGAPLSDIAEAYESDFKAGFGKIKGYIVGYGEGEFKDDMIYISLRILVGVKGSYKHTLYTFVGTVPGYMTMGAGADVSASASSDFNYDRVLKEWDVNWRGFEFNVDVFGTIGAGIGIPDFSCIEGEVKTGIKSLFRLQDNYRLITLYMTGTLRSYICFVKVGEIELFDESYVLDENYGSESLSHVLGAALNSVDINKANFIQRASPVIRAENYQLEGVDVVAANTYQNAMPKMIMHEGKAYLFWLADNLSRDVEDRSMLVYSVNDGSGWSTPTAIEDDGTADAYFDVAEGDGGIHVVWHDSTGTFDSDDTLTECMASSDISYAFINTSTSEITPQSVTTASGMDTLPKIASLGSGGTIVWVSNSDNNALMNTGVNTIHKAEISGGEVIETESIGNITSTVNNLDVGYLNGTATIAYVLDTDNDFATQNDKEMYVKSGAAEAYNFTDNAVMDANACFAKLDGTDMLFWYSNGNIDYVSDVSDTPDRVFNGPTDIGSNFNVINGNSADKIIWNEAVDENGELKTVTFAVDYTTDWTSPYLLADLGSGATVPTGYIDSECRLAYLVSNGAGVDLVTQSVASESDIALDNITYSNVVAGSDLAIDMQVSNTGMSDLASVDVEITRNGTTVQNETIAADIPVGMTANLSTVMTVPFDVTINDDFQISVSVAGESDISENEKAFKLGYSDLILSADYTVHNGEEFANIYIKNASSFPTDATLFIRQNDENGDVISKTELTAVNQGGKYMTSVNLSAIYDRYEISAVYAQVVGVNADIYELDNAIYLHKDEGLQGDGNLTPMTVQINATECSRGSSEDGTIAIEAEYGSGYYECSIDNAATWQTQTTFSGLAEGIYDVYVRDIEDPDVSVHENVIIGRYGDTDLNNDGSVDLLDLVAMAKEYGEEYDAYDINVDGIVNLFDIMLLSKDLRIDYVAGDVDVGSNGPYTLQPGAADEYTFIPTESRTYTIYSSSGIDTLGMIYDGEAQIAYDDDSGVGTNFSISIDLQAGTQYTITVQGYSDTTEGEYILVIE